MSNIRKTLNLPHTNFSMKGNLIYKEPNILKEWKIKKIYKIIKKKNEKKKKFILHDGPPYANGDIHIGHALNKILKDIIIKSKNISGLYTLYQPSWDCHGLPIEHQIEKKNPKKKIKKKTFRKNCKKYVIKNIKSQKKDFIRLGVIANWNNLNLTMDYINQANIIRTLSEILKKGYLYQEHKPVYWCTQCKSSLAEAEIEYKNKTSPGMIVIFEIKNVKLIKKKFKIIEQNIKNINILIWTTTPWTLPSNAAIAVNANITYQFIKTKLYTIIIAKKLVLKIMNKLKIKKWRILKTIKGYKLEYTKCRHPFLKKNVPIILSPYVTEVMGTGAVHIAPDHGQEDYIVCKKYKIKTKNLIDNKGNFKKNIHPIINNKNVSIVNKKILDILIKNKKFIYNKNIKHNYPHCWRHKYPIIFRATLQWFIDMNKNNLRKKCIQLIKKVNWVPNWGFKRMKKMLENRPDWCISRQRTWGIPLTIFINKKTGQIHPQMYSLMQKISKFVEINGTEEWWNNNITKKMQIDKKKYKKTKDVLDVWFESGALHISKIFSNKKKENIADIYIEGSDQYRGWFMSSLIISTIIQKKAPYKTILTHGFAVDHNGNKMSKSLNNTISPNYIIKNFGADILRLWASSTNYCNDIVISKTIIQQSIDNYKKIRNTIRFLIANLKKFKLKNIIKFKNMVEIDKWIILKTKKIQKKIIFLYSIYKFHEIIQCIMNFCIKNLSSFYLDIIKDRQYTLNKQNKSRLSSQTTIFYILKSLIQWICPILSFTANEIWNYLPKDQHEYIFTTTWFEIQKKKEKSKLFNDKFWKKMIIIKNEVNKALELSRNKKEINSSLEAIIILYINIKLKKKINLFKKEKKFLFITSGIKLKDYNNAPRNAFKSTIIKKFKIVIKKHNGHKCPRCWNYVKKIIILKNEQKICKRCLCNLFSAGEKRKFL